MAVKNNNKYITFVCEAEGCTKERTVYKTIYDSYKNHACSRACAAKLKKIGGKPTQKTIIKKIPVAQRIAEYWLTL